MKRQVLGSPVRPNKTRGSGQLSHLVNATQRLKSSISGIVYIVIDISSHVLWELTATTQANAGVNYYHRPDEGLASVGQMTAVS